MPKKTNDGRMSNSKSPISNFWYLRIDSSMDFGRFDVEKVRRNLWWVLRGSNSRHSPCKGDALPTELSTHAHSLVRRLFYNIVLTNARFTLMCNGFCNITEFFMGDRHRFLVLCAYTFRHFS